VQKRERAIVLSVVCVPASLCIEWKEVRAVIRRRSVFAQAFCVDTTQRPDVAKTSFLSISKVRVDWKEIVKGFAVVIRAGASGYKESVPGRTPLIECLCDGRQDECPPFAALSLRIVFMLELRGAQIYRADRQMRCRIAVLCRAIIR